MNRIYASLLFLLAVGAAAATFVPLRLLRPFRPQTESEVALAYDLFRWGPLATLAALALGAVLSVLLWRRRPSWWLRVPAALLLLVLAGLAYASRENVFTRLFAPLEEKGFVAAAEAEHVSPEEMVLGVSVGSRAKAYPVTMVAYHHVVNDEIGGVPVAVTY